MPHNKNGRSQKSEWERGWLEAPWLFSPPLPESYPLILQLQKAVVCRELQLWQGQPENVLEQGGLVRKQLPIFTSASTALLRLPAFPWQARQREHRLPALPAHTPPSKPLHTSPTHHAAQNLEGWGSAHTSVTQPDWRATLKEASGCQLKTLSNVHVYKNVNQQQDLNMTKEWKGCLC